MTTAKPPIFLRIFKNGKMLDVKQFTGPQVVIGREGKVDAAMNDPSVSPIHAMIEEREDGKHYLCDLGSQTGTFVNGEKIIDHALETGNEFQIGDLTVEFHVGVPKPKKAMSENTMVAASAPASTPVAVPAKMPSSPPQETKVPEPKPESKSGPKSENKTEHKESKPETFAASSEKTKGGGAIPKDVPKENKKSGAAGPLVGAASLSVASVSAGGGGTRSSIPSKPPKGTFAPSSSAKLQENLKPGRGNVVEVAVVWKDRILSTYHFDKSGLVKIGSHPHNQIILPHFGSVRVSHPLIKVENGAATVYLTQDMTGELVKENSHTSIEEMRRKGVMIPSGTGFSYGLQQNEVMKINFGEGVSLIVRFVANGPDSRLLPFVDLTVNQLTGLVVGLMATALFLFYAYLYAPTLPDQVEEPEPPRKAQFFYKKHEEAPVKVAEEPVAHNAAENVKSKAPPAPAQGVEGASQEPKHSKTNNKVAKKQGKSKTTATAAAAPKTPAPKPQKDVSKMGLMGAFATNGTQSELNKAFKSGGAAQGAAQNATGQAGGVGDVDGGQSLHDIGANGNGTATVGIAGVQTKGRGGGVTGYGTGGLGAKKYATLIAGDDQATFTGSIDKEAIRRVVQANLRQIKSCYERGLNQEPGLYGKIVIKWTIGPGGRVLEAAIGSTTMNSTQVENCAVAHLKTWKFPEPPAGEVAVVSYPFVFQAQE